MNPCEEFQKSKISFKCGHDLLDNLFITYNTSISTCVLFNKYQIFLYDSLNFDSVLKMFDPDFHVQQLLLTKNYIICLDTSGNIHTTSLNFKLNPHKRVKSSFQSREIGILCFKNYNTDSIISLKEEYETYYICIYNTSSELQIMKKISISLEDSEKFPTKISQNNCLLAIMSIPEHCMEHIKEIFGVENVVACTHKLIMLSFDKLKVYACLLSNRATDEELTLKHIYTSPSQICDINITETDNLNILIGLSSGTLIKINLVCLEKPEVIHLNTALSKFIPYKCNVIYTDGISLWKADISVSENVKFSQLFVKQIKDLFFYDEQVICTSFANMIYVFNINDNNVYVKHEADEYCPADKILNNMECINKIMEEVEKSNKLAKEIDIQKKYLTALALSNRQDIMEKIVCTKVFIYESYEELIHEGVTVYLTDSLEKYFDAESILFLVKISASDLQNKFSNVLSSAHGELKVHVTLNNDGISETTSVTVNDTLKKLNLFIPFKGSLSNTKVHIELIINLPGAHDETQKLWTILYQKKHIVGFEQLIKSNLVKSQHISLLKKQESTESKLLKMATKLHGNTYKFTETNPNSEEISFYVRLPNNYKEIFLEENNYKQYFSKRKSDYLQEQLKSNEFLNSKSKLCFEVGKHKVKVEIVNDFSVKVLKLSCENMEVCFSIRNYFSKLIYNDEKAVQESVKYAYYTAVENLEKEMKRCIENGMNLEKFQFQSLADQYQKNVLSALPL